MTFEEFAAARLPAVLKFAAVLTGDRGLAEDVVEEVLIRANARWQVIENLPRPEAYVRKMIVNEYLAELAKLPRRQRAVVVLRYYEGLSDQEIADVLGCKPGTVRSVALLSGGWLVISRVSARARVRVGSEAVVREAHCCRRHRRRKQPV
jgi:DNA-directed RNA polymerase specialized sigma24 family protein